MTRRSIISAAVAFGLLTVGATGASAQTRATTNQAQCFTDDGYGRLRSCSQNFKKSNPNWRTSDNCYVNDSSGRYRSCSAGSVGFKKKKSKP